MRKEFANTFFNTIKEAELSGVAFKNLQLKKRILHYFSKNGQATIPDLSKALALSVPKMSQLIHDLVEAELVQDFGKIDSQVGRRPNIYGLKSDSAFFVGVEVKKEYIHFGITDFSNRLVQFIPNIPYALKNTPEALEELCQLIAKTIKSQKVPFEKILGLGVNLSGRINHQSGYSYSYFNFSENPLSALFKEKIGLPTFLENDSRAMGYGEFKSGLVKDQQNVLFINVGYGIGMSIMINGALIYGKSGFSGELGHIPIFDNEIICHCGKKGCLETEASGKALIRKFYQKLQSGSKTNIKKPITSEDDLFLDDIIEAALKEDTLAIELIDEVGKKLGKGISALLHLYNPELVIIGGSLARTGDYLFLPIKMSVNKYALSLVRNDTKIVLSKEGEKAGVLGACILVREYLLKS
ncbi:ROK family transcriptional regulator [Echinicola sediminis]